MRNYTVRNYTSQPHRMTINLSIDTTKENKANFPHGPRFFAKQLTEYVPYMNLL